ncbi:MAG: hypothetical protein EZS28_017565 [Streblomastix strix]|uniref:Uncharacterized protein n=1 Tax=Streblomastix strix TaxID=222440 RepID=A0A5J4VWI7_9EUKA|nr:MAG: hypothetical protein EZS28_017565 [Streblomastix strix]
MLNLWKNEIFWIHPPISKIGKTLIVWNKFKLTTVIINREFSDIVSREEDDEKQRHFICRKNRYIPYGPRMELGKELLTGFLDKMNKYR